MEAEHSLTTGPLDALLRNRRVVVVLGTGGVGKTTVAAAIGVGLARHRRVLVLTVDPSRRLRDALKPPEAGSAAAPRRLPDVDLLDVDGTVQRLVLALADDRAAADRFMASRFFRYLDRSLPGLHHYTGIFRVLEALDGGRWDTVVVDTPPMDHALEFLGAAERIQGVSGLLGIGLPRLVIRSLRRFLGGEFATDLFDFFDQLRHLLRRFEDQARRGRQLLASDATALLLVSAPDRDADRETGRLLERLPPGHSIDALLLNRVLAPLVAAPEVLADRLLATMEGLPAAPWWLSQRRRDLRFAVLRSLRWHEALTAAQRPQVDGVLERCRSLGIQPVLRLPFVPAATESPAALAALYDAAGPC